MKGDIQSVFQEFGDEFVRENRSKLTDRHLKAIDRIQNCGTPAAGFLGFSCSECGKSHLVEKSCGDRHCPSCQHGKTLKWVEKRLEEQLPTHHFLVTFTVPAELRPFMLRDPAKTYPILLAAASGALKRLTAEKKFLGVDLPGFFCALHTWGRTLSYHPHVHFVVPGGGVDGKEGVWKSTSRNFLAPGQALSKVFKGLFSELVRREELNHVVDPKAWSKDWVVDCQAVGQNGEGAIKYLAPYVFRTAISDSRIVSTANGKVTFTYAKPGSRRQRRMTLDAKEFIRRYLIHVLPKGLTRVRYYGFMGSGCSITHDKLLGMVREAERLDAVESNPNSEKKEDKFLCPRCGGALVFKAVLSPWGEVVSEPRPETVKRE